MGFQGSPLSRLGTALAVASLLAACQSPPPYRAFPARLSLDTGYVPCQRIKPPAATGCALEDLLRARLPQWRCSPPPQESLPSAERLETLRKKLERDSHGEALVALLSLTRGDLLADTVAKLEAILEAGPRDARILSDLAAASLRQAAAEDRPDFLLQAVAASQEAVELEPDLPIARFNHALALTELGLWITAREAWEDYLALNEPGPWSEEARGYLASLPDPSTRRPGGEVRWKALRSRLETALAAGDGTGLRELASGERQLVRERTEGSLLREWAEHVEAGNMEEAARTLALARVLASELAEVTGDRLLEEAIETIDAAGSPETLTQLASGHRLLARGTSSISHAWKLGQAQEELEASLAAFTRAGSPFQLWARFYLALNLYYRNEYGAAERALLGLQQVLLEDQYPVLSGRIAWILGLAAAKTGRLPECPERYGAAAQRFCSIDEVENAAASRSLLAAAYQDLGRSEDGWRLAYGALLSTVRFTNPNKHHAILEDLAFFATRPWPRAALAVSEEHLRVAKLSDSPPLLHNAHLRRFTILSSLGRVEEAEASLILALQAHERVKSPEVAAMAEADVLLGQAREMLPLDPEKASHLASLGISVSLDQEILQNLPEAYALRAEAFRRTGHFKEAGQDLALAVDLVGRARQAIPDDRTRTGFSGRIRPTFDAMIRFQYRELANPRAAFGYAERSREALFTSWLEQSALTESSNRLAGTVLAVEILQASLPETTALLEYAVLEDQLLIWALTQENFFSAVTPVSDAQLANRVETLRAAAIRQGETGWEDPARTLYRDLVSPVLHQLEGVDHLVLVPDKALNRLPFEMLLASDGRFLIESFSVVYSPGAAYHHRLSQRAAELADGEPGRWLILSGTARGGRYPLLEWSEREARDLAGLLNANLLRGEDVDTKEILAALGRANAFLFSGHAVPSEAPPNTTRLVLEDRPGREPRYLDVEDFQEASLRNLRLVVLSACATAESSAVTGDPLGDLVRPFLAKGVPAVVGTQWPVYDAETATLMKITFVGMAEGTPHADALREAKLSMLRSSSSSRSRHPAAWAAFVIQGS